MTESPHPANTPYYGPRHPPRTTPASSRRPSLAASSSPSATPPTAASGPTSSRTAPSKRASGPPAMPRRCSVRAPSSAAPPRSASRFHGSLSTPPRATATLPVRGDAANSAQSLLIMSLPGKEVGILQPVYLPVARELTYNGSLWIKHVRGPVVVSLSLRRPSHSTRNPRRPPAVQASAARLDQIPLHPHPQSRHRRPPRARRPRHLAL